MADYCGPECYAPGGHHGPSKDSPKADAYYDREIALIDQEIKDLKFKKKLMQKRKKRD